MIEISLPWPPSVNTYWRSLRKGPLAGRVLISEKGRAYRAEVSRCCYGMKLYDRKLAGRLAIHIIAYVPDRRKRDLDNLQKSLLDSLAHAGVIVDDSQFDDIHIVRGEQVEQGRVDIKISLIQPASGAAHDSQERTPA